MVDEGAIREDQELTAKGAVEVPATTVGEPILGDKGDVKPEE